MYVRATSTRFSRGMSIPAIRAIRQPCRCLCLGFSQMTITVPWRRMTLQLSHRVLTDALTFTGFLDLLLLQAVGDPTPREVVGRQLHADPVPGQDPDEVHPELAADVRKDAMAVLQLDCEHRVRQWLDDGAFDLDRVLLRQPCSLVLFSNECRPAGPTHER